MLQVHDASMVLSGTPSQSLSAAELQSRALGNTAPSQAAYTKPTQVLVPFRQTPALGGPHSMTLPSTHVQPSLGTSSQSASLGTRQLSAAGEGPTEPLQAPQSLLRALLEATQSRCPAWHGPWPSRPGCAPQASELPGTQRQTFVHHVVGLPITIVV